MTSNQVRAEAQRRAIGVKLTFRAIGVKLTLGSTMAVLALAVVAGPAAAASPPVYNSIPDTLPGNVVSVGFQATSTSEFGDYITFGGTERARANLPVTVVMSIWACQTGGMDTCATTPGATFAQPLTLTIYAVDHSGAVPATGTQLLQTTQTFNLPYRPSRDDTGHCQASGFYPWYSTAEGICYSGLAHEVTFTLPAGPNLPSEVIWSIAFNTETHGYNPTGVSGPYNSLNVGAQTFASEAFSGTDNEPDGAFTNSTWSGGYGDGGAGGIGIFRDDTGWTGNRPLACFGTACPVTAAAPTASPSAAESILGASSNPSAIESVGGETSDPNPVTPPPTSTGSGSGEGPGSSFALLICGAFAAAALMATAVQRRSVRR